MFQATKRVRRGSELLDRHRPGWEREVDTEQLDLGDTAHCLLGQLYGDYQSGCDAIGLGRFDERATHGFNVYWPWQAPILLLIARLIGLDWTLQLREFRALHNAWLAEIRARRHADATKPRIIGNRCRTRHVPIGIDYSTGEC
jgi:hypothetical protein